MAVVQTFTGMVSSDLWCGEALRASAERDDPRRSIGAVHIFAGDENLQNATQQDQADQHGYHQLDERKARLPVKRDWFHSCVR